MAADVIEQARLKAQADSAGYMKDAQLAQSPGSAPAQLEARRRVARLFCDIHFAKENPEARASHLARVDYAAPITTVNGRSIDPAKPKSKGFLGLGRRPAYLLSSGFPPQKPEDPIYALEYYPLKS